MLAKIILSALVISKTLNSELDIIASMGVIININSLTVTEVIGTYICDILFLFISPLLIQSDRLLRQLKAKNPEEYFRHVQFSVEVRKYYSVSVGTTIILATVSALYVPSAIF